MWSIERHHLAVDLLCARKFAPPLLQLLPGIRFVQTIYVKRLNDGCIAILEQGAELVHLVGADGRRGNVDGEVAALLGRLEAEPAFRGRGVHDVVIETLAGGPGLRAVRSRRCAVRRSGKIYQPGLHDGQDGGVGLGSIGLEQSLRVGRR